MNVSRFLTVAAILLLPLGVACADIFPVFSDDGGSSFSDTFSTTPGGTVTVGVYVEESAPNTELSAQGLIGFGFDITHTTGLGSISSATPNAVFDIENHNVTNADGFEWEYFENTGTGISGNRLFLGAFDFDATANGTTTFTLGDRLPGTGFANESWLTPGLTALDEDIFGAGATGEFEFFIVAVPEPGAFLLAFPMLGAMLIRRRKI